MLLPIRRGEVLAANGKKGNFDLIEIGEGLVKETIWIRQKCARNGDWVSREIKRELSDREKVRQTPR